MNVGSKKPVRTRAPHLGPEKRRPQVLDAALALVVAHGTRGVTMESLAERLGVSKPVVYACFASREEVLTALLEREEQKLFAGVMAALPANPDFADGERTLIAGFQAMLRVVEAHATSWQLVFIADADSTVAERYGMARRMVKKRVKDLMKARLAARNVPDIERKLPVLVDFFMAIGESAVQSLLSGKGQWTPDELGTLVAHFIQGGITSALTPSDKAGSPSNKKASSS